MNFYLLMFITSAFCVHHCIFFISGGKSAGRNPYSRSREHRNFDRSCKMPLDLESYLEIKLNEIKCLLGSRTGPFLSDPCAHGVRSLGRLSMSVYLWLKPCEDLVKTVNVVNVVKT